MQALMALCLHLTLIQAFKFEHNLVLFPKDNDMLSGIYRTKK